MSEVDFENKVPFYEEDYFVHNLKKGSVHNRCGTKMCFMPNELLFGLYETLQEEVGDAWTQVIERVGKIWGKRVAKRFENEMTEYYGRPVYELPMTEFKKIVEAFFAYNGWGVLTLNFSHSDTGIITARLKNSAFAEILGTTNGRVDGIVSGLLGELFNQMSDREDIVCYETECISRGDNHCSFVMGISSRLKPVASWIDEGISQSEIVSRLETATVEVSA